MKPELIKRLRESLNLSQEQFAQKLGCRRWSVIRWEQGTSRPHKMFIQAMRELGGDRKTERQEVQG